MKRYIVLITLLFFSYGNSQNNCVTYNFRILENKQLLKNSVIGEMYAKQIKAAKFLEFKLTFNDSVSKFENIKSLGLDETDVSSALTASRCKKEKFVYKDSICQNNPEGAFVEDKYIIVSPLQKKWTLTNESKNIDKYTCYKATTDYVVVNSKGEFTHPVVAWYCPELSYQFGPAGYGGLPGLILELQERNNLFGATKIEFKASEEKIIVPTKGIKISEQDYQIKIAEVLRTRFE